MRITVSRLRTGFKSLWVSVVVWGMHFHQTLVAILTVEIYQSLEWSRSLPAIPPCLAATTLTLEGILHLMSLCEFSYARLNTTQSGQKHIQIQIHQVWSKQLADNLSVLSMPCCIRSNETPTTWRSKKINSFSAMTWSRHTITPV